MSNCDLCNPLKEKAKNHLCDSHLKLVIQENRKQGARDFFDYIKKLQPKGLVLCTTNNEIGYFVMRKDLNKYLKNTERWGSPKNTIKKHKLNKKLRSDKK